MKDTNYIYQLTIYFAEIEDQLIESAEVVWLYISPKTDPLRIRMSVIPTLSRIQGPVQGHVQGHLLWEAQWVLPDQMLVTILMKKTA